MSESEKSVLGSGLALGLVAVIGLGLGLGLRLEVGLPRGLLLAATASHMAAARAGSAEQTRHDDLNTHFS